MIQNHNPKDLELLKKRAKVLAQEEDDQLIDANFIEVTEFSLNSEQYGFESQFIGEVHNMIQYTKLPNTPDFVFGIMNIRSRIITIIDIKRFFGLEIQPVSGKEKVIILSNDDAEMGILVDSIEGVSKVEIKNLEVGLPTVLNVKAEFLLGIARDCLCVLDAEKILSSKRVVVNEEV